MQKEKLKHWISVHNCHKVRSFFFIFWCACNLIHLFLVSQKSWIIIIYTLSSVDRNFSFCLKNRALWVNFFFFDNSIDTIWPSSRLKWKILRWWFLVRRVEVQVWKFDRDGTSGNVFSHYFHSRAPFFVYQREECSKLARDDPKSQCNSATDSSRSHLVHILRLVATVRAFFNGLFCSLLITLFSRVTKIFTVFSNLCVLQYLLTVISKSLFTLEHFKLNSEVEKNERILELKFILLPTAFSGSHIFFLDRKINDTN